METGGDPVCSTLTALELEQSLTMPTEKRREAAKQNIKKAQSAAQEKRTIAHLPKSTRTALGKQGAKSREKSS